MRKRERVFRWMGAGLGAIAAIIKAAEAKEAKETPRRHGKQEVAPQLREADVLGQFRLGYVDCIPYSGPEQLILIEPGGAIECFQEEALPGLGAGENRTFKRRELGRLKAGSLLKGEVQPASEFHSRADEQKPVSSAKIQLVNMPGGPGVWFAMRAELGNAVAAWDEIYVRETGNLLQGVQS